MFSLSICVVGCTSFLQGANGVPETALKPTTNPTSQPVANSAAYNLGADTTKVLTTAGALAAYMASITPPGSPPSSIAAIIAAVSGVSLATLKIGLPIAQKLMGNGTLHDKLDTLNSQLGQLTAIQSQAISPINPSANSTMQTQTIPPTKTG